MGPADGQQHMAGVQGAGGAGGAGGGADARRIQKQQQGLALVHSSRESKKTLLTMFFTKEKLFLAFLMNRCTKGAVRLLSLIHI